MLVEVSRSFTAQFSLALPIRLVLPVREAVLGRPRFRLTAGYAFSDSAKINDVTHGLVSMPSGKLPRNSTEKRPVAMPAVRQCAYLAVLNRRPCQIEANTAM